jgi:Carboxypeptidase activation peptide
LVKEDADGVASLLQNHEYDFWVTPRVGRSAQIMVSNASASELQNSLSRLGLQPSLLVENVERCLF